MTSPKGVKDPVAQGGLESVSKAERVASLTGIRAIAALLVMATHAAYTTGKYTHGYIGLVYSRMEIGVPIFFVLSGFLLFGPWVKAVASDGASPSVRRYAWHRVRRIMPAYVVTVLVAFAIYHWRTAGPIVPAIGPMKKAPLPLCTTAFPYWIVVPALRSLCNTCIT